MAKLLKIGYKSLSIILEIALLLFIVLSFSIRFPAFQTFLAQQASVWLSKELKTTVRIDNVDIAFFDHVYINGVYVEDLDRDTLAYLGQIELNINAFNWSLDEINLDKAAISDGKIYLIKKLGQDDFNYEFIEDYFASDTPSKPKKGPGPKIHLSHLIVNDVDFKYILEYRRDYEHGINFNKLDLRKINLFVEDLTIQDEHFIGRIASISAQEKSGFVLDKFSCDFDLKSDLLKVKDARIETKRSDVRVPSLVFKTGTWDNYNYFEDSVFMDIRLDKTITHMEDIAYFAEDLWGMNQEVYLSGRAKDYVYNLKIQDLYLETGRETILRGNFELPDFRLDYYPIPKQDVLYLQTSYRDLLDFRLPNSKSDLASYIDFPKDVHTQRIMKEAGLVQIYVATLYGVPENFTLHLDKINSGIGTISAKTGIEFKQPIGSLLTYQPLGNGIELQDIDLGKISGESILGLASGVINFSGKGTREKDILFDKVEGNFSFLEFNDYRYKNISLEKVSVTTSDFKGIIWVNDNNANLSFDGHVSYDSREEIEGKIVIKNVDFEKIGLTALKEIHAHGTILVKTNLFSPSEIYGGFTSEGFSISKNNLEYTFQQLKIGVDRSGPSDVLKLESEVLEGSITGVLDFDQIAKAVQYELSLILPLLVPELKDENFKYKDYASFEFKVKDAYSLLYVIDSLMVIDRGTQLNGSLNGPLDRYAFNLKSPHICYGEKVFTGVNLKNDIDSAGIEANYTVQRFNFNDSLHYDNIVFKSHGTNASFLSNLTWGEKLYQGGELKWTTEVHSKNNIEILPEECFFYVESERWELNKSSIAPKVTFKEGKIYIYDLMFFNELQYVDLYGVVSDDIDDALNVKISDFDIDIFNKIYLNEINVSGSVSGNIDLHNLLHEVLVEGTLDIDDLSLNDNYIGTINLESSYDDHLNKIILKGGLYNQNISKETVNYFSGNYRFARNENGVEYPDELDFLFDFTTMDISFANAFVDEQVASEIQGLINGVLVIKGSTSSPLVSGNLMLENGQAKIDILGTNYRLQGPINITNYGFSVINMPILDQENNAALLSASVFHDNFRTWDYNVFLDLTRDGLKRDPQNSNAPARLERFLALNTEFNEGDVFYGKGYVTGNVNIYGTDDFVEITANVRSERGTKINFPMYGRSDLKEEDFVIFVKKVDSSLVIPETKIDFTGVRLNLNIEATPDADLSIIFDDRTGDEINAVGSGKFRITLDELNNVTMIGTYEVDEGEYNFALGVVKKLFKIEPGSTVKWMGDPYEATLNVRTYYLVEANIQDISAVFDREAELRTNARDQIYCYLSLKDRLSQPVLEFDIEAPRASDAGRVAINRVRADADELTRQFFSLLLMRQFQPLRGSQTAANTRGSNALNELLANQINAVLGQLSGNYDLRFRMNDDGLANQSTYALGFSSSLLDNRLIISGSFGVSQMRNGASMQGTNPFIGDVNIEYKLNRSGTFRVNVFNRSNQFTVIQSHNLGLFTQGVGIYYQESFSGWHDFQMIQYTLDAFRPYPQKRFSRLDSRMIPLPPRTPVVTPKEENAEQEKTEETEEGE